MGGECKKLTRASARITELEEEVRRLYARVEALEKLRGITARWGAPTACSRKLPDLTERVNFPHEPGEIYGDWT